MTPASRPADFIRERVRADNAAGVFGGRVQTRFPPEPNGYLHIGHAKSVCLNYGVAAENDGRCTLRFDDTNPAGEDAAYAQAIIDDVAWLGFGPGTSASDTGTGPGAGDTGTGPGAGDTGTSTGAGAGDTGTSTGAGGGDGTGTDTGGGGPAYASDYFEQLYEWAEHLVRAGLAYVDDQDAEAISAARGDFTTPGADSPWRERSPRENLRLLRQMRAGRFEDGARVLRAKIDMAHPNMAMRDPVMYRIRHAAHFRAGGAWCLYPTYDWAHGQSDAIEGVTHSLCTLEFESHRPLYDWFLDHLPLTGERPRQTEFARLNVTHTVTSKRRLAQLVDGGLVDGWDDPRMPTLRGLRRRGYPPEAVRAFCAHIGVAKVNGVHEIELLESFVRAHHNRHALRRMAVLRPLEAVIANWPAGRVETRRAVNNPEDASAGTRPVPLSGRLWIERADFMIDPPRKFYRLAPGREVRLRAGYFLRCEDVDTDPETGEPVRLWCRYDPATGGGRAPDGRRVRATIHWVSADHAVRAEVALYDRLFADAVPGADGRDPLESVNPDSRKLISGAPAEPALADAAPGEVVQFERLGYFARDPEAPLLFHRTVGLRDDWARIQKRRQAQRRQAQRQQAQRKRAQQRRQSAQRKQAQRRQKKG